MSAFFWSRLFLLGQINMVTVTAWSLAALFTAGAAATYLKAWLAAPWPAGRSPLPVSLPADPPRGPVAPYGAPALKALYRRALAGSLSGSAVTHTVILLVLAALLRVVPAPAPRDRQFVVDDFSPIPRPVLVQEQAGGGGGPVVPPAYLHNLIPVPVRDDLASAHSTIMSMKDLGLLAGAPDGDGAGSLWSGRGGNDGSGWGVGPGGPSGPFAQNAAPAGPAQNPPVDQLPVLVTIPQPDYPTLAREAGLEGTVELLVLVGTDGHAREVRVARSVPVLDMAARRAALGAVFRPALWKDQPVAVWVALPVRFQLQKP